MKRLIHTLLLISASLLSIGVFANASFTVGPPRKVIDLKEPQTLQYIVRNTGTQSINIRVRKTFFKVNSRHLSAGNPLHPEAEMQASLVRYMIISPQALSLQSGQQATVRVSIQTPGQMKPGTYRAQVLFKMLQFSTFRHTTILANKQVAEINMLLQIAPIIYGNFGNGQANINIETKDHKKTILLTNKTSWHYSGDLVITQATAPYKQLYNKSVQIFRDSIKSINLSKRIAQTPYTIKLTKEKLLQT